MVMPSSDSSRTMSLKFVQLKKVSRNWPLAGISSDLGDGGLLGEVLLEQPVAEAVVLHGLDRLVEGLQVGEPRLTTAP